MQDNDDDNLSFAGDVATALTRTTPGHRRRISEPPELSPRRSLFERTWSTHDVTTAHRMRHPYSSMGAFVDIAQFQDSWGDSWTNNTTDSEFLPGDESFLSLSNTLNSSHTTNWTSWTERPVDSQTFVDSTTGLSSAIHDAARITDWDTVLELCQTRPESAAYAGRDGWTALHHACNRRCPRADVVHALIEACPENLLKQVGEKGWLPLHYACRFKAPKAAVQLLLYQYPQKGHWVVSKRDRLGRTPLFYAVRYDAPPGVVGLLLQMDPSVVLEEDQNDDSPLALVWDSWAEKLEGKKIVSSFLPGGFDEPAETSEQDRAKKLRARLLKESKLRKKWEKANMLLKAALGFPVEDDDEDEVGGADSMTSSESTENSSDQRTWRIVHATAAVKCHLSLFLLACALHPEQVAELDESDLQRPGDAPGTHQTALHLAASSNAGGEAGKAVVITLLSLNRDAAEVQDGIDGSLPLHRMVENERKKDWPQHAAILYHFYPRAVQIADHNGRLPLHRAAAAIDRMVHDSDDDENNDTDLATRSVIVQLVRAFPQAASRADSLGFLPFHLAAMNAYEWDDNVEAIYNSHRAAVHVRGGPDVRLPLHMASANAKGKESLIQRLLQLHPRAATLADRHGRLPLHLACAEGKEWESTRHLHEAFPVAVRQVASPEHGWLPLHMACASPSETDLIPHLVRLYPAACSMPDRQGRYPLHLACESGKSWCAGGLSVLLKADASVTATPDAQGRLPFYSAAFKYCRRPQDEDDENLPSWLKGKDDEIAKRNAAELDVLFQLLRADPTILA